MTLSSHTALLLVDVQQGLDEPRWGARNNPGAERNIAALLAAWRQAGRHVIHVQHMSQEPTSPLRPDHPGNAFKPEATPQPGEAIVQKRVNSAFIGTTLETYLRSHGIEHLVIAGITTDHCVSSTTRMAANLGFTATVVSDATATFERTGPDGKHHSAEQMHCVALASLHGEFATIRRTDEVLAESIALDAAEASPRTDPPAAPPRHVPTRGLYGHITHTDLASDAPAATRAWCTAVLGWTFKPSFPTPQGDYHLFVYSATGGGGIRSTNAPEVPGSIPYIHVADASVAFDAALREGAVEMLAPTRVMEGVTVAIVRAPGGVAIGLSGP